ncbi:hypothetical protein ABT025_03070 [Streptomyces sp. NPDC002809]|uniref:hypothetical protein n=1 Tax=Streptomyces sp. NPDC002809 TaxID=3154433 RepID=UPI00333446C3
MASDRATRLHRLARSLTERFGLDRHRHGVVEAAWCDSLGAWTLAWTDGPTVAEVRAACPDSGPETGDGLRYVRTLSEEAVALGVVRLTVGGDTGSRPCVGPADVEALFRDEPFPVPHTERERDLVYAIVYEIHDAHRRNSARPEDICGLVNQYGLAVFLRRYEAGLAPAEVLTAHYAATHAHPAWRHRLALMDADVLVRAVRADPGAPAELVTAALALLPGLPAEFDAAGEELRARLRRAAPPAWSAAAVPAPGSSPDARTPLSHPRRTLPS